MSESVEQKQNGLSAVQRLKTTDKYLTEMGEVLKSMDEIAALRKSHGEAVSDEYGGYKRSSVESFIRDLKKQKAAILEEMEQEEKRSRTAVAPAPVCAPVSAVGEPTSAGVAPIGTAVLSETDSTVASFQKGDPSLALESMYAGLSMDIERAHSDILQEMKYTYKQDMAIYDDIVSKIDAIQSVDSSALEEQMKPLGENMASVSSNLTSLGEKLNSLQNIDYDAVAEHVAEKMVGGIDYNALAQHIVGIMTCGMNGATVAAPQERSLLEIEKKIDRIESVLEGAVNVKQMPEFRHMDRAIEDYLVLFSYDLIPDILMSAEDIKKTANQYIERGNVLRGELMLSALRSRLSCVNVWGSSAVAVVADAVETHHLPLTYSTEAFNNFMEATREYEQAPANPDDAQTNKLLAAKKAMFADPETETADRDVLAEMLEIQQSAVGELDKDQIDSLMQLKKELMSFNLSYFIDLTPEIYEEKEPVAPVASAVDTQAIINAIHKAFATIPAVRTENAATASETASQPKADVSEIRERISELSQGQHKVSVKQVRKLRPAVSSKDNKLEKTEQPLRITRNKIRTTENDEALSKQVVDTLAQRIANSMVK